MIKRGVINKIDSSTDLLQTVEIHGYDGEFTTKVDRFQGYGFSSYPIPMEDSTGHGAEVVIADLGSSDLKTIIATDDRRFRPVDQQEGEVVLYTNNDNQRITLKKDGSIILNTGSSSISLKPSGVIDITCTTLNVSGNTNFIGSLSSNGTNISDTHTHSDVQAGVNTSGYPVGGS